jgi:hypothetical protein
MAGYPGTQLVDDEAKERFRRVVGDARTRLWSEPKYSQEYTSTS